MKPDELIALWAHRPEDLSAAERADVEALFERDPTRRDEALAMRALLVDVRALPEPAMPSLLAAQIAAAIDRERGSRWARLRAWVARPIVGFGLAAATAGGLGLWVMTRVPHEDEVMVAPVHAIDAGHAPAPPAPVELFKGAPAISGELADLGGLDEHALDALSANLDDELGEDAVAPPPSDDGLLADPDLGWVDELSSSDVDALDHYLDTHRSPT